MAGEKFCLLFACQCSKGKLFFVSGCGCSVGKGNNRFIIKISAAKITAFAFYFSNSANDDNRGKNDGSKHELHFIDSLAVAFGKKIIFSVNFRCKRTIYAV